MLVLPRSLLALSLLLSACASQQPAQRTEPTRPVTPALPHTERRPFDHPDLASAERILVLIATSNGDITLELDYWNSPVTVVNFLTYASRGEYDNTIIHRVVPGFVIQGGGWTADLQDRAKAAAARGEPDKPIKNEWKNGLKNRRGTIAVAREADPDSATREFFINLADNARLDSARPTAGNAGYAVFGRVISGMDIVDAIARVPTAPRADTGVTDGSMNNVPLEPVIVHRIVRVSDWRSSP